MPGIVPDYITAEIGTSLHPMVTAGPDMLRRKTCSTASLQRRTRTSAAGQGACTTRPPHLKRQAVHDFQNQFREFVIPRWQPVGDGSHDGPVVALDASAERINHQLFGKTADKSLAVSLEQRFQLSRCLEGTAIGQGAGSVHRK